MKTNHESNLNSEHRTIDTVIKLTLIALLLAWCAMILLPFIMPVLWGVILAVTLFPLYSRLLKLVKGRKGLSATFITLILLALLIIPSVWLISSIVGNARELITSIRDHTLVMPPPKPEVADWPIVGKPIYAAWQMLSTNIETAIQTYRDKLLLVGDKFLGIIKSVTSSFLILIVSVIISGILLAGSEKSETSTKNFANRLVGKTGDEFVKMIVITIRNVAKGILGVAFIQFVLMGGALMLAKVPFAGLWALAALLFAIVQAPVGIVAIPIVIYLYSAREPVPATLWSILIILISLSDNFIKPYLMGKGAPVPTLVIFLGAIGGMIMSGFIGLFTGAIILSLGYKLATMWLGGGQKEPAPGSLS
jgi:predicted PurR-regulated permease PerM